MLTMIMLISLLPTHIAFAASGQDIVNYAYDTWKGTPWKKRNSVTYAPGIGVDCSALMQYAYGHYGYSITSSTYSQRYEGININHSGLKYNHDYSLLQPGDLIFFNNYEHVGMYAGNGRFVHASYTYGVVNQVLYGDGYNWHQYACEVRRILPSSQPVHTHSWNYGNDSGHPHKQYKQCSCGEKQYTGTTNLVASCSSCYPLGMANLTRSVNKTDRSVEFYRNNVVNANSYEVTLFKNGVVYGTYSMPSTSKRISDLPSGEYSATLTAKNTKTGQSSYSLSGNFNIVDTYLVTYDANGGENAPSPQTKIQDVDMTITSSIPRRTGYIFKGWAPNRTSTEPQYLSGGSYTKNTKITLYAVWEPEIYTINFDVNGGKGETPSTTITYGNTMKMPNTVIREGYYLKGWSQTKGASNPDYKLGIDYKLTSNMTLYAVWGQSTWGGTVARGFAGGDGTEENPYQISNAAELAYLADIVNNQQSEPEYKYYVLTDNINLGYEEWIPIGLYGNENQYFKGSFDGNGYTISDLNITDIYEQCIGLFGFAKDSEIKNLTVSGDIVGIKAVLQTAKRIENGFVDGAIGAIIGFAIDTNLNNCDVSYVNISDIDITPYFDSVHVGCIVGHGENIANCTANECYIGTKYGCFWVGIIAGAADTISDCTVTSSEELFGTSPNMNELYLGGICGRCANSIERCEVNAGFLSNDIDYAGIIHIGGIVGYTEGKVDLCLAHFFDGTEKNIDNNTHNSSIYIADGTNCFVGGIVGATGKETTNCKYNGQSIVSRGYSLQFIGGIVGFGGEINRCFAHTDGIIYGKSSNNNSCVGGVIGDIGSPIDDHTVKIENSIAIADKISSNASANWSGRFAYAGDIKGYNEANLDYNNLFSYSNMQVSAQNIYDFSNARTNIIGGRRTLTQIKRASFLNQVYEPAYQSVEYLKENPEAVWVIRDGEHPELYFTMLNDITVSEVENGTISVDKTQAVDGEIVMVTAVPDENYVLNKIYVNGNEIVGSTFEVFGDSDIYATFAEKTAEYNVKVQATENASAMLVNVDDVKLNSISLFSNTDSISAADGEEIKVSTSAEDNYTVDAVYVNGEELAGDSFIVDDNSVVTMEVASTDTTAKAITYDAKDIKGNGATLSGKTDSDKKYIRYWKADMPDEIYTTEVQDSSGEYSVEVTDLELGETYEYQMTEFGDVKSFVPVYAPIDDSGSVLVDPDVTPIPSETDKPIVVPKTMPFEIQNTAINIGYISTNVANISDVAQSGMVIFVAYSDNGALLAVKAEKIEKLDANASRPYEFELPSGMDKCKLFVWKSWTDMLPLADSVEVK